MSRCRSMSMPREFLRQAEAPSRRTSLQRPRAEHREPAASRPSPFSASSARSRAGSSLPAACVSSTEPDGRPRTCAMRYCSAIWNRQSPACLTLRAPAALPNPNASAIRRNPGLGEAVGQGDADRRFRPRAPCGRRTACRSRRSRPKAPSATCQQPAVLHKGLRGGDLADVLLEVGDLPGELGAALERRRAGLSAVRSRKRQPAIPPIGNRSARSSCRDSRRAGAPRAATGSAAPASPGRRGPRSTLSRSPRSRWARLSASRNTWESCSMPRSSWRSALLGVRLAGEHELGDVADPAHRRVDLVGMDRVAQAQHLGVRRDDLQPRAPVAVLHDDAVDHHPLARPELEHEPAHAAFSTSPRRPFMIAVLMSMSGAIDALARPARRIECRRTNSASPSQLRAQRAAAAGWPRASGPRRARPRGAGCRPPPRRGRGTGACPVSSTALVRPAGRSGRRRRIRCRGRCGSGWRPAA
jgi:hypothetical protein